MDKLIDKFFDSYIPTILIGGIHGVVILAIVYDVIWIMCN